MIAIMTTTDKEVSMPSPRVKKVLDATSKIFDHPTFYTAKGRQEILLDMPGQELYHKRSSKLATERSNNGFEPELLPCYEQPLLTAEQEYHLFRQYNFWKHRARQAAKRSHATYAEHCLKQAYGVRSVLACANMRLARNLWKKIHSSHKSEVLSEGYMSVLQALEGFDYRKGVKFSTYATYVLRSQMMREAQSWFRKTPAPLLGEEQIVGGDAGVLRENQQERNVDIVEDLLRRTEDERERTILILRFGLQGEPAHTLEEVGKKLKITKERVRQLQDRTIGRLRAAVDEEGLEFIFDEVA